MCFGYSFWVVAWKHQVLESLLESLYPLLSPRFGIKSHFQWIKLMEIETGAVYAMELETQRKLLKDVFGGSSSSDSDTEGSDELISSIHNLPSTEDKRGLVLQSPPSMSNPNPCWERITAIDGLWLCNNFLSLQQQSSLLSSIQIGILLNLCSFFINSQKPLFFRDCGCIST